MGHLMGSFRAAGLWAPTIYAGRASGGERTELPSGAYAEGVCCEPVPLRSTDRRSRNSSREISPRGSVPRAGRARKTSVRLRYGSEPASRPRSRRGPERDLRDPHQPEERGLERAEITEHAGLRVGRAAARCSGPCVSWGAKVAADACQLVSGDLAPGVPFLRDPRGGYRRWNRARRPLRQGDPHHDVGQEPETAGDYRQYPRGCGQ